MIKHKKNGELIVISGTTCAGKGTVIDKLIKRNENLALSISYTSRPMREGEVDGKDYIFISQEEFEKKIENGDFLEYAKSHRQDYYGTPKQELIKLLDSGKDVILEINIEGAKKVKELFPEVLLIFIMAPSMSEVKRRIKERGKETPSQIIERFKTAYKELNEIPQYNYVVINDKVENAVDKVEAILKASKCRVDRIEEISMENEEEILHEFLIDNKEFINEPIDITRNETRKKD